MEKIVCESCGEKPAQITYIIGTSGNATWAECFECLKKALANKDSVRAMFVEETMN